MKPANDAQGRRRDSGAERHRDSNGYLTPDGRLVCDRALPRECVDEEVEGAEGGPEDVVARARAPGLEVPGETDEGKGETCEGEDGIEGVRRVRHRDVGQGRRATSG